eukprot:SAG31_NODE_19871_length_589_cov_1.685714_1_plen_44_part_00
MFAIVARTWVTVKLALATGRLAGHFAALQVLRYYQLTFVNFQL